MKKLLYFFLLLPTLTFSQGKVEDLMESARKLMYLQNEPAALSKYMAVLDIKRNHYEALWNASILLCRVGTRISDEEIRDSYFNRAESYAKEAILLKPEAPDGYFALSYTSNRKAEVAGSREKGAFSKAQKTNAMLALKNNNKHGGAWHLLGLWHFRMANLKGTDKAVAGVFFGGSVQDASNENAIKCFTHALEHEPGVVEFHYDLARAYQAINRIDLAREECKTALLTRPLHVDDTKYQQRCKGLLEELN